MLAYVLRGNHEVAEVVQIPAKDIKLMVTDLATTTTDAMQKRVIDATPQICVKRESRASKGCLPFIFAVDVVLVANVRQAGRQAGR